MLADKSCQGPRVQPAAGGAGAFTLQPPVRSQPGIQPPGTTDQVAQDALGSVNVRLMRIGLLVMTRAVRVPGCTGARKCRCIVWHSPGGASGRIQLLGSCSDQWPVKGLYGAEGGRAFPHIHPSPANTKCPLAVGLSIHPVEVFI